MDSLLQFFASILTTLIVILTPQNTYTEGVLGQPISLLPNELTNESEKTLSSLIFRGIFTYNSSGELVNDLAESYTVSDDGLSYTIYIKKNQRWTNGNEITTDDLLYSAFTSSVLTEIATDKIDKYTIRYTLPNKYSPFLNLLTKGVQPAINGNNKLKPVSSGPYKVVRVKNEGPTIKEIVLQKVDSKYLLNRVSFRFYQSDNQLILASKLGEIDGFATIKNIDLQNFNKNIYFQRGVYYSLIFNTKLSMFKDAETRKKFLKATPAEKIAKSKGLLAEGPLSESLYNRKDLSFSNYDPDFKDNLKLKVVLTVPNTKEHIETAEFIKTSWKNIGVEVEVNAVSADEIEKDLVPNRDFEILLYGQEVSRDPDRYSLWHSSRIASPGLNLSGFENIRLDRSLEEGRGALKFDDRKKHYNIFQEVIHENAPVIFLYHPVLNFYSSKKVKIVRVSKLYYGSDRFLNIKDWEI